MNKKDAELSDYIFGKVQPQALPLEEAVLGAILIDKDALSEVVEVLRPDDFYVTAHQLIYKACMDISSSFRPIDLLTVTEGLKKSGDLDAIGGAYYLIEMTNRVGSSANIAHHAAIIKEKSIQRKLGALGMQITKDAFEDALPTSEMLQSAEKGIFAITNEGAKRGVEAVGDLIVESLKRLDSAKAKKDGLTGVPSGFTSIDRIIGGWQDTDLIIVAGRPGSGKTSYALNCAINAAEMGFPVLMFSLEMSSHQLIGRLISSMARVNGNSLTRAKLDDHEWQQVHAAAERIAVLPIYIDDTPGLSVSEMRSKARSMKMRHDIKLIIADYIQLATGERQKGDSKETEVGSISKGMKNIAKEISVPFIALSQLSRAVETRGGTKRPMLSDLRDSGSLEQDADIVQFIYRPEYYGIMENEDGTSTKGLAEVAIAKHRNGEVCTVDLRFDGQYTTFSDKDDFDFHVSMPVPAPSVLTTPEKRKEDDFVPF